MVNVMTWLSIVVVVWALTLNPVWVVEGFHFVSFTPCDVKWYVDVWGRWTAVLELKKIKHIEEYS